MPPQSRSPLLWLVACAVVLAAGTLLLFLLAKNPADSPDVAHGRESEHPVAAEATAQDKAPAGAERQRTAQPLPAEPTVADGEHDARYRKALAGIKGRVLLHDDKPLPDLSVEAFRGSAMAFLPSLATLTDPVAKPPTVSAGKVRTDPEGRFLISPVEPRSVYILVLGAGTGRACFRVAERSPSPGETVDVGDIVMPQGGILAGTVLDDEGAPVGGAKVWVADFPAAAFTFGLSGLAADGGIYFDTGDRIGASSSGGHGTVLRFPSWVTELEKSVPVGEAITGSDGAFRLEGVKAGRPSLWIRKKGLIPLVHGPVAAEAGKERDVGKLKMKHGEKATGCVVDASGARVRGAEVMVGVASMSFLPMCLLRRLEPTDGQGRFVADCLGREKILLVARRHEGDEWTCTKPLAPDDTLQVQLEEGGTLRVFATSTRDGVLRDAKFRVAPDNEVMAVPGLFPPLSLEKRAAKQEDGSFKIAGLRKGKWRVQGFAAGHAPAGEIVEIEGSEEKVANLQMSPQVEGRIRVVDDATSEPVAFARVMVQGEGVGNGKLFAERVPLDLGSTDRAGELGVTMVAAGTHDVYVRHPQFGQKSASLVLPGPTLVVRMEPGGSIAGTVTKDGTPLTEIRMVALETINPGNAPETEPPMLTLTVPGGTFRYEGVAPGKYRAQVLKRIAPLGSFGDLVRFDDTDDAAASSGTEVEVLAGKETRVALSLASANESGPTGRIVGQVLINGAPRQDLAVSAWSGRRYRAVTDAAGRFELARVEVTEQVTLSISDEEGDAGEDRTLARRVVRVKEGETAEVRIAIETGNLHGRVTAAADGSAIAGAAIQVNMLAAPGAHEDSEPSDASYSATTDETGSFRVKNIAAGNYAIGVRHEGFAKKPHPAVIVRRGEETDVQIQLVQAVTVSGFIELEKAQEKPEWLWVSFLAKGASEAEGTGTQVDSETGRFECGSLMPGKYRLTIYGTAESCAPVDFEVTGNMKDVRIPFVKAKAKPSEEGKEKKDG